MLHRNTLKYSSAILMGLMLTGCANIDSIYRHGHLSKNGQTEYVDAKQRAIIAAPAHEYQYKLKRDTSGAPIPDGKGGWKYDLDKKGNLQIASTLRKYKFCSEAAPDVFTIRAASASGNLSSEETGNLGAAFGLSTAEAGATIERTQVVNMLRESMFRTCERFMNGAIDEDEMSVQTARDQRMMVATLAIEQLTGVVKRRPTILTTSAMATISEQAGPLIERLAEAETNVTTLKTEVEAASTADEKAQAEYKALNKEPDPGGFCDAAITADVATPSTDPAQPQNSSMSTTTMTGPTLVGAAPGSQAASTTTTTQNTTPAADTDGDASRAQTATPEETQACKDARETANGTAATLAGKKAELAEAEKRVSTLKKRLDKLSETVLMASGQGDGDSGNSQQCCDQVPTVAKAVQNIAMAAFNDFSELNFACVREVKRDKIHRDSALIKECFDLMRRNQITNAILMGEGALDPTGTFVNTTGDTTQNTPRTSGTFQPQSVNPPPSDAGSARLIYEYGKSVDE